MSMREPDELGKGPGAPRPGRPRLGPPRLGCPLPRVSRLGRRLPGRRLPGYPHAKTATTLAIFAPPSMRTLPSALVLLLVLGVPFLAACGRVRQAGGAAPASPRHGVAGAAKEVEIQEDPVKTGIEAGDAGLASQVRTRLAGDPELRTMRIEVDAEGGRVTLWGRVDQAAQREAAERLARRTPRVAEVIDLIKVGEPGSGTR